MNHFTVAIVGRPNVGKSTLFNRLVGHKAAIVYDQPGVTRDWQEETVSWGDMEFKLVDTAGFQNHFSSSLSAKAQTISWDVLKNVDLILFVVDGRVGVIGEDRDIANRLRKLSKPMRAVANKIEGKIDPDLISSLNNLGLGEGLFVSAEHGLGLADLYQTIYQGYQKFLTASPSLSIALNAEEEKVFPIKLAIIGRPNVGKSSLINAFLKQERLITSPEAGTTRDTIWLKWHYRGHQLELIDTAGLRKKAKVLDELEKISTDETEKAIKQANIVVLVVDINSGLEGQDLSIANQAEKEGKALIIALNKWDLISDKNSFMVNFRKKLENSLPQSKGMRFVPVSAKTSFNLELLLQEVIQIYDVWNMSFTTLQLNQWLGQSMDNMPPPLVSRRQWNIKAIKQTSTRPPTIMILSNLTENLPESYQKYLVNRLRDEFDMRGVPIRLRFTKRFR